MLQNLPKEIFKAYDIRGIVGKTLTPEIVKAIGHAIGSEALAMDGCPVWNFPQRWHTASRTAA
jgi:hypothetical protein